MRTIVATLLMGTSAVCSATPITYYFDGLVTNIQVSNSSHDPLLPLLRGDGTEVTNGDNLVRGEIVFDPEAWRDGAGGTGWGEVLSWKFTTQGLNYWGPGGSDRTFHYLNFDSNRFLYLDEVANGGYGPDVTILGFDFDSLAFESGPDHFPVENFVGGHFSTAIDLAWVDDKRRMEGLEGVITSLWTDAVQVPTPSSFLLLTGGLLLLGGRQLNTSRHAVQKNGF